MSRQLLQTDSLKIKWLKTASIYFSHSFGQDPKWPGSVVLVQGLLREQSRCQPRLHLSKHLARAEGFTPKSLTADG